MISPNTAPGTRVVVISPLRRERKVVFDVGTVMTVASIQPGEDKAGNPGFGVDLREDDRCAISKQYFLWPLWCFKLTALPDCLVEAQHSQPLIPDHEKQRANADAREREYARQFLPFA